MAEVCSHQDESRKKVSVTAHATAFLRSMESKKHGKDAWFVDSYAELLGGQVGVDYINKRKEEDASAGKVRKDSSALDMMSIRTRKVDEEILKGVNNDNFQQVCVVGAGLDARAWRLSKSVEHSVSYFELDFPEVFEYKLAVLKEAGAVTPFDYHAVPADMSMPGWTDSLLQNGKVDFC